MVSVDAGPIPVAQVRPTAQARYDLKEYLALREALQAELKTLHPSRDYMKAQRITGALWKAATMTSHRGRMATLRKATGKPSGQVQTALF